MSLFVFYFVIIIIFNLHDPGKQILAKEFKLDKTTTKTNLNHRTIIQLHLSNFRNYYQVQSL